MPKRPKIPYRQPSCAELVEPGRKYCEKHLKMHPEEVRSAAGRGYGAAWRRARKAFLQAHPLCAECMKEDRYVKATDVDHIVPHHDDMKLFWDRINWQALCYRCHSRKTRREEQTPEYKY